LDIRLEHVDPNLNKFRFYEVGVEPNLLGDHSIIIRWGRIGRPGRVRIHASGPKDDVAPKALKLVDIKIRNGYVAVTSQGRLRD